MAATAASDTLVTLPGSSKTNLTTDKKKKVKKSKVPKLVFSSCYTVYPIVKKVGRLLGFRVIKDDIQLVPPAPGTDEYLIR